MSEFIPTPSTRLRSTAEILGAKSSPTEINKWLSDWTEILIRRNKIQRLAGNDYSSPDKRASFKFSKEKNRILKIDFNVTEDTSGVDQQASIQFVERHNGNIAGYIIESGIRSPADESMVSVKKSVRGLDPDNQPLEAELLAQIAFNMGRIEFDHPSGYSLDENMLALAALIREKSSRPLGESSILAA